MFLTILWIKCKETQRLFTFYVKMLLTNQFGSKNDKFLYSFDQHEMLGFEKVWIGDCSTIIINKQQ